jgi:hypothetical protein
VCVNVCAFMYVWVCVWHEERKSEYGVCDCVCVCVCVGVCMYVIVCVTECV